MNICLVRPTVKTKFAVTPPLSLGYLSSALKKSNYKNVSLVDGSLDTLTPNQAVNIIKSEKKADVIGIQVYTGSHVWTRDFIKVIKEELPKVTTLVGGPHISSLHSYAMEFIGADYGVKGEGEEAIVKFMQFVEGKIKDPADVPGLMFKKKSIDNWQNAKQEFGFIENANDVSMPDWKLLQPNNYFKLMQSATLPLRGKKPTPILTSRGCPYRCTFCSAKMISKRMMRYRDPKNIISEIEMLNTKYGIDEIFFADDNLTMNLARAEELFDLIIKSGVKIHWRAPNGLRIDRLGEKLIEKMSRSGCYYVGLGIESGNQRVLKSINKQLDLKIIHKQVNLLHKYGIMCSGFFMCGMIGENEEEIYDSIKLSTEVPFDRIQIGIYTPYPGSDDFETIMNLPATKAYSYNVMHFQKTERTPQFRKINIKKLVALQKMFLWKFYFRPRIILSLIGNIRISQIKAVLSHPIFNIFLRKREKDLFVH